MDAHPQAVPVRRGRAKAPHRRWGRERRRGFTLIELLVALFITAIVFLMGYGAINQALKDRQAIDAREQRLTTVETAMRVLVQDFSQLTPRPVRDELGETSLPCLIGSPSGVSLGAQPDDLGSSGGPQSLGGPQDLGSSQGLGGSPGLGSSSGLGGPQNLGGSNGLDLVAFTRAGWANPAGVQRPAEERVSYRLVNGVLERLSWPELDVTEGTPVATRKLLDHVKSVSFLYLDQSHQWTDQWPPVVAGSSSPAAGNQTLRMRPLAVEVTLDLDDWGTVVRIIEVPT
ncbi:MAG: type II secretion system minor pseudopilin GspJ [Steroidobacteraceae bacterium]